MNEDPTPEARGTQRTNGSEVAAKLDAAGWGLFFVWIGFAFLTDIPVGFGLLGVGVITLAGQAARRLFELELEAFWLVVGGLFVLGGVWELLEPTLPLLPLLSIVAGVALIVSAVRGKSWVKRREP